MIRILKNKSLIWLFGKIWRKWLNPGDKIMKITGIKSCIIDSKWGQRSRSTFIFRHEYTRETR